MFWGSFRYQNPENVMHALPVFRPGLCYITMSMRQASNATFGELHRGTGL